MPEYLCRGIEVNMEVSIVEHNLEEKLFCTTLALELLEDATNAFENKNSALLITYISYLRQLCDYLSISFDAPKFIEADVEVFTFLQHLLMVFKDFEKQLKTKHYWGQ